jgi:hypothetical protein
LDELDSLVVVVAVVPVLDDLEPPWLAARAAPPPPNATAVAVDRTTRLRFGRNTCHLLSRRERLQWNPSRLRGSQEEHEKLLRLGRFQGRQPSSDRKRHPPRDFQEEEMSELDERFQNEEEENEVEAHKKKMTDEPASDDDAGDDFEAHKKRMNDEPASEDDSDDDVEAHLFQP